MISPATLPLLIVKFSGAGGIVGGIVKEASDDGPTPAEFTADTLNM